MRLPLLTPAPVRLPLACDPLVANANTAEALARYADTGDPSGLIVPEGATWIVVRPLTPLRRAEVEAQAGPPDARGATLALHPPAEPSPEDAAALWRWRGWSERLTLLGLDAVVTVEGAPTGMPASEVLGSVEGDTPAESVRLRRLAVAEAAARAWSASLFGASPKAP